MQRHQVHANTLIYQHVLPFQAPGLLFFLPAVSCMLILKVCLPFEVVLLAIVAPSDTGDAGVSVEVL